MNKIVREHINEFEKGGNSLGNLGIGKKALALKWLKQFEIFEFRDYILNDNGSIIITGGLNLYGHEDISYLPDDLHVKGYLDIRLTSVTELPNNLKVDDWLDITQTDITDLPESLNVKGKIYKSF
jgi:hypothetical protein